MTLDDFTLLLETFGTDLGRWPEAARTPGRELVAATPEARARHEAAAALDRLFLLDRAREAAPARRRAVEAAALRRVRSLPARGFDWRWLVRRPLGAALAATLVAGVIAGLAIGPALAPWPGEGVPAIAALLGAGGLELGSLL